MLLLVLCMGEDCWLFSCLYIDELNLIISGLDIGEYGVILIIDV